MMWTLLNPRTWIAFAIAAALIASHYQSYRLGKSRVQQDWTAANTVREQEIVKLAQDAIKRERVLSETVTKGAKRYENAKKTTAAVTSVVSERVQHFQAELDKRDAQDSQSSTIDHGRTPERLVLGSCARSFYQVGSLAEEQRQQIIALQAYINSVTKE